MISPDSIVIEMRPLAFCFPAIRLMTSNLALRTRTNLSWSVIFGKVPKLRITMLAMSSDLSQNSSIHQCLNLVFEDKTSAGTVMHHPMKKVVVWIICTPHFIRLPNFG